MKKLSDKIAILAKHFDVIRVYPDNYYTNNDNREIEFDLKKKHVLITGSLSNTRIDNQLTKKEMALILKLVRLNDNNLKKQASRGRELCLCFGENLFNTLLG